MATLDVSPDQIGAGGRLGNATIVGWLDQGCSEYLGKLPPDLRTRLAVTTRHMYQRELLSGPCAVSVAVGVTELRPRTFDMQVRVRENGTGSIVASGGCTIAILDAATGEQVDLPPILREGLIQLEREAAFYC